MGRVYDSDLGGAGDGARDFGPGWKLAVRETLATRGTRPIYTDASNSAHALDVGHDGGIAPAIPALAPVSSGRMHETPVVSVVELQVGDTVRHFVKRHDPGRVRTPMGRDGPWRLTHVRHARGWMRLDWQSGAVTGRESDGGSVEFVRRADRGVPGRSVAYGYDKDGALTAVVDPRGKTILAASHADGKVATVRALHAETAFHYRTGATRAVDGLGRTTTLHRAPDGRTTGVADATGRLTQLEFDAEFRPVTIITGRW